MGRIKCGMTGKGSIRPLAPLAAVVAVIFCALTGCVQGAREMTVGDLRRLAAKGDALMFQDFARYQGVDFSGQMDSGVVLMQYGVEGNYRLTVRSKTKGKPDRVLLENIWDKPGNGIDIRVGDLEAFLSEWPVLMRVKPGTVTPGGLTVTLTNVTDREYGYGENFSLERKTGTDWEALEPVTDMLFHDIGYGLLPNGSDEKMIAWEDFYGLLTPGSYRVVKRAIWSREPGDYTVYPLYAVFAIGES